MPSMKNEKRVKSCMSSALTASITGPCEAPVRVNQMVTPTRQSVRKNMSALMRKKRPKPLNNRLMGILFPRVAVPEAEYQHDAEPYVEYIDENRGVHRQFRVLHPHAPSGE